MTNKKAYKFGVEIELGVPSNVDEAELQEAVESFGCNLKGDSSLSFEDGYYAWEITTPPLGYNEMGRTIKKLSKYLTSIDAVSNKSCGLHIHTSNKRFFKNKQLLRIMSTWIAIEDVLYATQPQSRLTSTYCKRLLSKMVGGSTYIEKLPRLKRDLIDEASRIDRYCALNLNALDLHGTLEVRLFAGTTNAKKILAYLELTRAIYDYAISSYDKEAIKDLFSMTISADKIAKVFGMLQLSKATTQLLQKRIQKNLFATLARQQKSAFEYKKIQPKVQKAIKKYNKARADYDCIMGEVRQFTNAFSAGSY